MAGSFSEHKLVDLVEILDSYRRPISSSERQTRKGTIPYYGATGQAGWIDAAIFDEELVLLGEDAIDFSNPTAKKAYLIKGPSWVNNHVHVLRANPEKVDPYYLVESLNRVDFSKHATFGTRSKLTQASMRGIKVLLPSLSDQKRIVDLISTVDSYIISSRSNVEIAKRTRKAVLHQLLSQGGEDWFEAQLGSISEVVMGRQLSPSKKLGFRPKPYIRAANIGSWGINLDDIYEMDFTEREEQKFACQVGDTLIVEGGNEKSVGSPAIVSEVEAGLCIQNTVIRCRTKDPKVLDPNFQFHVLRFMFWRGDFAQLCAGTTIMHLGQKRAAVLPIQVPPLEQQQEIVAVISGFDDYIFKATTTLQDVELLRSGLLSAIFSGEHRIPSSYDKTLGAV
jgi:type I restriction enzyme S subunit